MKQVVYLSTATHDMSDEALENILNVSIRNNAKLGITGLLIIKGRTFMQALEGEVEVVDALYRKIEQDPRHKNIILLSEESITQRQFPNWNMGFKNLDHLASWESEKLVNFTHTDKHSLQWAEHPDIVHDLFKAFVQIG